MTRADPRTLRLLVALLVAASFAVGWWSALSSLVIRWSEPGASHGGLVVMLAAALAWKERRALVESRRMPAWVGPGLILLGAAIRVAGTWFAVEPLTFLSLVPALAGMTTLLLDLFTAGTADTSPPSTAPPPVQSRQRLAVLALPFALVVLALPLPFVVESEVTGWLQSVSTSVAVFGLQLLGQPVFAVGNVLQSGGVRVGVAEACSGLHLLSTQIVLAVALAFWTKRPAWQRAAIIGGSPLVAVATNAIRLAGLLLAHSHAAPASIPLIHDILGWLMAPLALAGVWLEIQLLRWIAPEASPANSLAGSASNPATVSAFVSGRSTWNAT
ncbi:MAG: exosortase/archaeosortase family protein [Planctomycetaceae bacterium]|nr:exosortase/archaeosortase family protein [Planctomycetaceae bacterium]